MRNSLQVNILITSYNSLLIKIFNLKKGIGIEKVD